MASVRARGNKAEVMLRKALWSRAWRYRTYAADLPGTPDIVFRRQRVAVFVDGDFWHGRILIEQGRAALRRSFRTTRREFWIAKITRNVERDRTNDSDLRSAGWRVIRVWERDILRDLESAVAYVEAELKRV